MHSTIRAGLHLWKIPLVAGYQHWTSAPYELQTFWLCTHPHYVILFGTTETFPKRLIGKF